MRPGLVEPSNFRCELVSLVRPNPGFLPDQLQASRQGLIAEVRTRVQCQLGRRNRSRLDWGGRPLFAA